MTGYDPAMTTTEQPDTPVITLNPTVEGDVPKVTCRKTARWQHDVATVTIFIAWLELMMILGRFPTFGLYVQMFTTGWFYMDSYVKIVYDEQLYEENVQLVTPQIILMLLYYLSY